MQEALLAAARQWPRDGLPANPRGWLIHVAARRLTDEIRAEIARRRREAVVMLEMTPEAAPPPDAVTPTDQDDTLEPAGDVLSSGAHPPVGHRPHPARGRRPDHGRDRPRVPRARSDDGAAHQPRQGQHQGVGRAVLAAVAAGAERPGSMPSCTSSTSSSTRATPPAPAPTLQRSDLSNEAIRLARELHAALPDHAETTGLLALMLLTDARRAARVGPHGELIPLAGAGPLALGPPGHRRRRGPGQRRVAARSRRAVSAAGGDRRGARRGGACRRHRLAADPRPLWRCSNGCPTTRWSR